MSLKQAWLAMIAFLVVIAIFMSQKESPSEVPHGELQPRFSEFAPQKKSPAPASEAPAFTIGLPIDCRLGEDCFIQNYVDVDPSPDAAVDYTCGKLLYEGHKGTDFRVLNLAAMEQGVDVLAVADGTVVGGRDGMRDVSTQETGREAVADVECGNGLMIDHGNGWTTQYCHLKKGSVLKQEGDTVKRGDVIGQVGLSGDTMFPHVHLSVRKDDIHIDPFTGKPMDAAGGCTAEAYPIWDPELLPLLKYRQVGTLGAGFSGHPPSIEEARAGTLTATELSSTSEALVFWVEIFGPDSGDILRLSLTGPNGKTLVEDSQKFDRHKASYFKFVGKKQPEGGWPEGDYTGRMELMRPDANGMGVILSETRTLSVKAGIAGEAAPVTGSDTAEQPENP